MDYIIKDTTSNPSGITFFEAKNAVAVTTGTNTITLGSTVLSSDYCLHVKAYNAVGEDIGWIEDSRTDHNFVITLTENGFIDYDVIY